jgi:hypothetical protein
MSDSASTALSSPHEAPFVYHLLALHHARRTGVLTVRSDGVTTDIYLKQGTPVFADRNTLAGSLGRTLLADGVISEVQYETVIAKMTDELFESEQMRFAEVAMALGLVTHEQVHTRLEQQIKAAIVACMQPLEPMVAFRPDEDSSVANYPCPVQPMVLAGVKLYYDLNRTRAVWQPDARAFAELRAAPDETAASYAMQPAERRYIGNIDGSKPIEELIHTGFLDVLHASQVIVTLLLTEGVRLYQTPAGARAEARAVAPVPIESDSARRRMSSPLLAAVQIPPPPAAPTVVSEASQAVSPPESRPPPPGVGAQARLQAEQLFVEGKRFYKGGNQARALRAFAAAARRDPACPEYALYEQWTQFLLHPPQAAKTVLADLNQLAVDAIRRDKTNAFAFYVYGRVAHARGNVETAIQGLKTAVRLEPGNLEAKGFLRALTKR